MPWNPSRLDQPEKPDKGLEGGSCNRQACQDPGATWYNHGSRSWYCAGCRRTIEFDSFNLRNWRQEHQPRCGHPMFETREMMDARTAPGPQVGSLDDGVPNQHDPSKRGFQP